MDWRFQLVKTDLLSVYMFNLCHVELQDYVKYKNALNETDETGQFTLHEAVQQTLDDH